MLQMHEKKVKQQLLKKVKLFYQMLENLDDWVNMRDRNLMQQDSLLGMLIIVYDELSECLKHILRYEHDMPMQNEH